MKEEETGTALRIPRTKPKGARKENLGVRPPGALFVIGTLSDLQGEIHVPRALFRNAIGRSVIGEMIIVVVDVEEGG